MSGIIKPPVGAQLKLDHPLARGLVGCWLFNEGSGDKAHDSSGQGNVGTLTNMDPATDWVGSLHGGALDLDGIDDYVQVASAGSLNVKNLTVHCCFKYISLGIYREVLSRDDRGSNRVFNIGSSWLAGLLECYIWNSADGYVSVSGNTTLTAGTRYGLTITHDGNYVRLYMDGKQNANPVALAGDTKTGPVPILFGFQSGANYSNVEISCVFIYDRALSDQEIAWLYAFPYAMFEEESPYWIPFKAAGGGSYDESITLSSIPTLSPALPTWLGGNTYYEAPANAFSSTPAISNSTFVGLFPSLAVFASTPALLQSVQADLLGGVTFASTPVLSRAAVADLLGGVTMLSTPGASMIGGMDLFNSIALLSGPAVVVGYGLNMFPSMILASNPALAASAIADFYNSLSLASTPAAVMAALADLFVSLALASDPAFAALGGSDFYESLALSSSPAFSAAVFKEAFGELILSSNPALAASALADLIAEILVVSTPGYLSAAGFDINESITLLSNAALAALSALTSGPVTSIGSKRASAGLSNRAPAGLKRGAGAGLRRDA
jgi:hypothetical protein